ncbi:hypothetical protein FRX31_020195 [Thalictrum thalictroides]|uniref:Uncharacterized protein n=1 Tax=Thalictrum thalictroides TaxID=46969 RepID=A0A7J6VZU5_THATH|nr:hypothetical protein FRX31_020195 [Thalictrum thalictroides]
MDLPVDNLAMLGENLALADDPEIGEAPQEEMAEIIHAFVIFIQVHCSIERSMCPGHFTNFHNFHDDRERFCNRIAKVGSKIKEEASINYPVEVVLPRIMEQEGG